MGRWDLRRLHQPQVIDNLGGDAQLRYVGAIGAHFDVLNHRVVTAISVSLAVAADDASGDDNGAFQVA